MLQFNQSVTLGTALVFILLAATGCTDTSPQRLEQAIGAGDYRVIERLLARGADPSTDLDEGYTPVMLAASVGDVRALQLLIEHGGDVNAQDDIGMTALMYAIEPEVVAYLIESGADVNARDNDGRTPLMYMVDDDAIVMLLEAGADAAAVDHDGRSVLDRMPSERKRDLIRSHLSGSE